MAGQSTTKPRQPRRGGTPTPRLAAGKGVGKPTVAAGAEASETREMGLVDLRRDRDRLAADLALARAEIDRLEKARAEAVNRIDWVIENLTTALQQKP